MLLYFPSFLHFAKFLSTTQAPATAVLTILVEESLCGLWEPPAALAAGGLTLWNTPLVHTHRHTMTQTKHANTSRGDVCCMHVIKHADTVTHMAPAFTKYKLSCWGWRASGCKMMAGCFFINHCSYYTFDSCPLYLLLVLSDIVSWWSQQPSATE